MEFGYSISGPDGAAAKHTIKNRFPAALIMHLQSVLFEYRNVGGWNDAVRQFFFSTLLINC